MKLSFLGYKSVIKKSGCAFEEEAECLLRRVFSFLGRIASFRRILLFLSLECCRGFFFFGGSINVWF
jgi:hypothetical protein